MAKFKVKAGAEIDILTPEEYRDEMRKLRREIRDERMADLFNVRRAAQQGEVAADGTATIKVGGPNASFLWDVRTVIVTSPDFAAVAGRAYIFRNEATPFNLQDLTDPANAVNAIPSVSSWSKGQFQVGPQESIVVRLTGAPAGQDIVVVASVVEMPQRSKEAYKP